MPISERPITPAQVRSIHVALRRRGIEDADYRGLLADRFGVGTCKSLTRRQASDLLALLGRPLPRPPGARRERPPREPRTPPPAGVASLPTPAQRALIAELAERVDWRCGDGLEAWTQSCFGWRRPRSPEEASLVIEGLKALCRRSGRWAG